MSFMEEEILSEKSPLFGQRTAQMKLEELSVFDMKKMMPKNLNEDIIHYYAAIGGTPFYVSLIDETRSFEENMLRLYYPTTGYLYDEPIYLIRQELREPALYNTIMRAIAIGKTKMNEIAAEVGEKPSKITQYLDNLIHLDIVKKEHVIFDNPAKSKKGIYRLKNQMFCYWYHFIFAQRALIEKHKGELLYANHHLEFTAFCGYAFEEVCKQWLMKYNGSEQLPFVFTQIGNWWGKDLQGNTDEIDIVVSNKTDILICECKWNEKKVGKTVWNRTVEKSKNFPVYEDPYILLFAIHGFDSSLIAEATTNKKLILVTLRDMMCEKG